MVHKISYDLNPFLINMSCIITSIILVFTCWHCSILNLNDKTPYQMINIPLYGKGYLISDSQVISSNEELRIFIAEVQMSLYYGDIDKEYVVTKLRKSNINFDTQALVLIRAEKASTTTLDFNFQGFRSDTLYFSIEKHLPSSHIPHSITMGWALVVKKSDVKAVYVTRNRHFEDSQTPFVTDEPIVLSIK